MAEPGFEELEGLQEIIQEKASTIVKVNTMLMTSTPKVTINPNQSVEADDVESRSFSLWDDDEE